MQGTCPRMPSGQAPDLQGPFRAQKGGINRSLILTDQLPKDVSLSPHMEIEGVGEKALLKFILTLWFSACRKFPTPHMAIPQIC